MEKKRIGLIGVGLVGSALAESLSRGGFVVHGYDLDGSREAVLREFNGVFEKSAADVGARCETVLLSVRDSDSVSAAVEGREGLVTADCVTTTVVDTTTGEPDATIAMGRRLQERGIDYLDATISGSSEQIRQKQGVFLVGGNREVFDRVAPIFALLSDVYHYLGPSGAGSKTKLASNLILGLNRLALAEGLVFAERLGLDLERFMEVIRKTPAYSAAIDVKGAKMLAGDFSPQSKISQHRKDLDIILAYAAKLQQQLPLTKVHHTILRLAEERGLGDFDTSAVLAQIRDMIDEA